MTGERMYKSCENCGNLIKTAWSIKGVTKYWCSDSMAGFSVGPSGCSDWIPEGTERPRLFRVFTLGIDMDEEPMAIHVLTCAKCPFYSHDGAEDGSPLCKHPYMAHRLHMDEEEAERKVDGRCMLDVRILKVNPTERKRDDNDW